MKKWLNVLLAFLMSGLSAVVLAATWEANSFVTIRGFSGFPISQRLLLAVGVVLFLFSGISLFRKARE
jgi:hypothetical protein